MSGSIFCYKVSFIDLQLPCSSVNSLTMLPCLSYSLPKENGSFSLSSSAMHCCPLKLQLMGRTPSWTKASRMLSLQACKVKSEDSEEVLSGERIILDEEALTRDLQIAIQEENYAQAAKIRDTLRLLQEDSKASVLGANARFYNAFRSGDLASMQALWSKGDNVCCVHPGASGVLSYDDVMESWELVWMNYDFPLDIELKNTRVHFKGEMGYVTCVEFVRTKGSSWGAQFVTNVFERIDGQWFICIHHASPVDL